MPRLMPTSKRTRSIGLTFKPCRANGSKRAYDLLVKDLPEDQKETVIAQIGRTTRRAVARVQGQQQQQKAEGVGV